MAVVRFAYISQQGDEDGAGLNDSKKARPFFYLYLLHVQPDLSYPEPFVAGTFATGPFATGPFEDGRFVGISLIGLVPCVH